MTITLILYHQVVLSGATTDSNTTLVTGAMEKDEVFKIFAYSELHDLATEDSPKQVSPEQPYLTTRRL